MKRFDQWFLHPVIKLPEKNLLPPAEIKPPKDESVGGSGYSTTELAIRENTSYEEICKPRKQCWSKNDGVTKCQSLYGFSFVNSTILGNI